jgi:N,N-dimethylformamidase
MSSKILGYCDRISLQAGDAVEFMASAEGVAEATVQLVRLIHGDETAGGPGFVEEAVATDLPPTIALHKQFTQVGSFAVVEDRDHHLALDGAFSLASFIWPTLPQRGQIQTLLSRWDAAGNIGYALQINGEGCLQFTWSDGASGGQVAGITPLLARCWYMVGVSVNPAAGKVVLYQDAVINSYNSLYSKIVPNGYRCIAEHVGPVHIGHGRDVPFVFAASLSNRLAGTKCYGQVYNGKIDRSAVFGRAITVAGFDELRVAFDSHAKATGELVACWDTSLGYGKSGIGDTIVDTGPHGLDAHGYNRPVRAMTGYNWNGKDDSYRIAPEQYGGIHFHEDALIDCRWDVTLRWTIPTGLRSACYALKLSAGDVEDYIPFFVRAARPKAKTAILMATASYLAYANEQLAMLVPVVQPIFGRTPILSESDLLRVDNYEVGLSTYDTFLDGAGVCFSSYHRPILNMRPKYRMGTGSTWQFPADLSLIAWLENQEIDYEVITDEDLHRDGLACLSPYSLVISGSHPEYYSERMLDATEDYLAGGGKLIYTGANGYYWVSSFRDDEPWCMEVRKLESGSRAWQAMPGEYYNQTEATKSGLWRHKGRAPQKLVGVGFASEGFDTSGAYSTLSDARSPEGAWIFKGVEEDVFGAFGLALGGAAGLELDRYDLYLGTPPQTLLLATSQGHSDNYPRVSEEIYYNFPGHGATQDYQCRADMIYFKTDGGGAVFATGSIAWASALPWNNFDNAVSTIMRNVVDAFRA